MCWLYLQKESVVPRDDCMIRSRRRYLTVRGSAFYRVLNEDFPTIAGLLQSIQIECDQIIEEEALDLTTKDVYLRAEDVQGMTITARGADPRWGSS